VKFAFIRDHLVPEFTVVDCCRVLGVSHSGYYRWRRVPLGTRASTQLELVAEIRAVHVGRKRVYGSRRVRKELVDRGRSVSVNTVAKVMKAAGIRSKIALRHRVRTTDSRHDHPVAPNIVDRDFSATGPNELWVCDITYVPTREGTLYLAGVMDVYSRKIVGWSMADHMRTDLVADALRMALAQRCPPRELVHHSDRGSQYASAAYREIQERNGFVTSMSRTGDCWDNAVKESFWATLKKETVHGVEFGTRDEARREIFDWIEVFYNRQRIHSALGMVSPEQFEAARSARV
jgi:transposase InsO family protein